MLTNLLKNASINEKIRMLFFPAFVILSFICLIFVFTNIQDIRSASKTKTLVELANHLDAIAHNHAVERGLTAGYLGNPNEAIKNKLDQQRTKADAASKQLTTYLEDLSLSDSDLKVQLKDIENYLKNIAPLRQKVDQQDKNSGAFSVYSTLNKMALDTIAYIALSVGDMETGRVLVALNNILWLKERLGQERGLVNGILASGEAPLGKVKNVYFYQQSQSIYMDHIQKSLSKKDFQLFEQSINGDSRNTLTKYRQSISSSIESAGSFQVEPNSWFGASTAYIGIIKSQATDFSSRIDQSARSSIYWAWTKMFIVLGLFSGVILVLWRFSQKVSKQMLAGINGLTESINYARSSKTFKHRTRMVCQDEIGRAGEAINALFEEFNCLFDDVGKVMEKVSQGDFSSRIEQNYEGDLGKLKDGVNNSTKKVELTMHALSSVMKALSAGDFSARMNSAVEGEFKRQVDDAMFAIEGAVHAVTEVMLAYSEGDFSKRISSDLPGQLRELKNAVNCSADDLQEVIKDISKSTFAQAHGDFNIRCQTHYKGDLFDLVEGINTSGDAIEDALKSLSKIFMQMQQGNFSTRIDNQMPGSLGEMAAALNETLESLESSISNILVAANAQKEGRLDVMVEGNYRGQLAALQTALNSTTTSLEKILTEIAQLLGTVADGRFDKRIESDFPGFYNDISSAINSSMDALQSAMNDIIELAENQKNGRLDVLISESHKGELGDIARALNESLQQMSSLIANIQSNVADTNLMSREVSQTMVDMSNRTESQASALEQINATVINLTETVKSTGADSAGMADKVKNSMQLSSESQSTMQNAVEAIEATRDSSKEISKISTMIDDIAFQTNLLALNAAVEAARAGEQGRGFAVVASEVRNLAQRSGEASKEIRNLINENVNRVAESQQLIEKTSETNDVISQVISEVESLTKSFVERSQTQTVGMEEIKAAVASLDLMTQSNAAMVEETNSATRVLDSHVESISSGVNKFRIG